MTDLAPTPVATNQAPDERLCHLFVWDQNPNDPTVVPPVGTPSVCGLSIWKPSSIAISSPKRRCAVCVDLDQS